MTVWPKFIRDLDRLPITEEEKKVLSAVTAYFPFRINEYYMGLIDWNDPGDPIRRIVIPDPHEIDGIENLTEEDLDPSREYHYMVLPGLEHKYFTTAVILASNVCGGVCRFCFRKRLFMDRQVAELALDPDPAFEYIRKHTEIRNVLITGGDPLMLPNRKVEQLLDGLAEIDHIRYVRIGSKMPAWYPMRISEDSELIDIFRKFMATGRQLYLMVHFNHPREITPEAVRAIEVLRQAGVVLANQTPILNGVNDDPDTLAELFDRCTQAGVAPYYVFQDRPTAGNLPYAIPVEKAYTIVEHAKAKVSGLAKRVRFAMSHYLGKVEVAALTQEHIIIKFHQAADPENLGKIMIFRRNPEAMWLDDYLKQGEVEDVSTGESAEMED